MAVGVVTANITISLVTSMTLRCDDNDDDDDDEDSNNFNDGGSDDDGKDNDGGSDGDNGDCDDVNDGRRGAEGSRRGREDGDGHGGVGRCRRRGGGWQQT